TFGLVDTALEEPLRKLADAIAERESAQSDNVYTIERDLEAYFNRVQDGKFKSVLDEMQATQITSQLRQIGETVKVNYTGQSLAQTEFWADTLDRWAEQLVGPGCPNGQCPGGDAASLPPSLVLEVMKIL